MFLLSLWVYDVLPTTRSRQKDPEREPLLRTTSETPEANIADYGSVDTDSTSNEEPEDNNIAKYRERHTQRVEQAGGLWTMLGEVRFLVPYIVPINSPRHQLYAVAMFLLMLCDRASNLLGPRLLGNIVERLREGEGTGEIPLRDLVIFVAVKFPHDLIFAPVRRWLSIRLYWWSYREMVVATFAHILSLSLDFHENKKTGEVSAAIKQSQSLNYFVDNFIEDTLPLGLGT
jgi:hypothetical protein